ncbi:MAG: tyrosine-protein phosphatase [Clostridia bacterium]|nr:tyrosine-protein phosphatase [Clostridia bacterium]
MEIKFQGAINARDLCDIPCVNGRKIKKGRIVRSSNLSQVTDEDKIKLVDYGLKIIVDFRTEDEVKKAPDKKIEGTEWFFNPIIKSLTLGITKKETFKRELKEIFLDFTIELGKTAPEWLADLYIPLVSDEFSLNNYRHFLDILKENKEGCVLFHCSAGKDRVGVGTMLILLLLGAKYEDILEDYLITNNSYQDIVVQAVALGRERNVDPEIIDVIGAVNGVDRHYLDKAYEIIMSHGSVETFFKNALNVDEKYIEEFRQNYLE